MDEALRNGRIRILDRCPAGWAYLSGAGCIRQVIYTIIEQDSDMRQGSVFLSSAGFFCRSTTSFIWQVRRMCRRTFSIRRDA